MRTLSIAVLSVPAFIAAVPASAQGMGGGYQGGLIPAPGPAPRYNPPPTVSSNPPYYNARQQRASRDRPRRDRWGGMRGGRWQGGWDAPGGWGAYRRPSRGWTLPGYWMSSNFHLPDYYDFGLSAPPSGYFWVRYYDDAVLVDSYGRVRDSVSGIAWASAAASAGADYGDGYGYASGSASASASAITGVDPNPGYYQGHDGDAYGASYQYPGGYAPPAVVAPPAVQHCPQACTHYGQQGYGYYYGGPVTTTVVVQYGQAATTTTTTEEVVYEDAYEDVVVETYAAPDKRVRRRYRTPGKLRPR